jgi:hypothetical protein
MASRALHGVKSSPVKLGLKGFTWCKIPCAFKFFSHDTQQIPTGKHFEKTMGFMRSGKLTFMGVGCYAL